MIRTLPLKAAYVTLCLAALAPFTAGAQQTGRPNPMDPSEPAPNMMRQSAFADYQPFQEQKPAPWRELHDEVAGPARLASSSTPTEAPNTARTSSFPAGVVMQEKLPARPSGAAGKTADVSANSIVGSGVIRQIDKANNKVKIAHEPIEALGWPKMTMFFRLKDASIANQVKEGDKVNFFLEKTASGHVISGFQKPMPDHSMDGMGGMSGHSMSPK